MDRAALDDLALWRNLVKSPGWARYEHEVRSLIFAQLGTEDPKVLEGMKRAIAIPESRMRLLEEAQRQGER